MTHNRILSIFCSKEDCLTILKEKGNSISGIHLDTTVVKAKLSLRKICSGQRKRYALQKSDYIIAIDHPAIYLFKKDYDAENLLHFTSLDYFLKWLNETFE